MSSKQQSSESGKIGIIGAGRIGQWFVSKVAHEGFKPHVFDVDEEALADAVEKGAIVAEHPADVAANVDQIVLCLPSKETVEIVMEGEDGLLESLTAGQAILDTSTVPPHLDVLYQKRCHERDAAYVDCGITHQGPGDFDEETGPAFSMFVGGEREDYEQVRDLIELLSYQHRYFEGVGNGHLVKAAVVLRATCRAAIAAEVCEFLSHNGVDPASVIELLDWNIPDPYIDPEYTSREGFKKSQETDSEVGGKRDVGIESRGARPRLRTSDWANDPSYALAVAHASNCYVPMLTAAHQTRLLTENYGSALLDRELHFGDSEWGTFHLRSLYRALNRPQEEWARLAQSNSSK